MWKSRRRTKAGGEDEKHTHIGLTNTQQMLHTIYGEEASMKIESTPGAGTCVTMCLPLEKGGRSHVESDDCR